MAKKFKNMIQAVYGHFEAGVDTLWDSIVIPGLHSLYNKFLSRFMRYDEKEEERFRKMLFWGFVFGVL